MSTEKNLETWIPVDSGVLFFDTASVAGISYNYEADKMVTAAVDGYNSGLGDTGRMPVVSIHEGASTERIVLEYGRVVMAKYAHRFVSVDSTISSGSNHATDEAIDMLKRFSKSGLLQFAFFIEVQQQPSVSSHERTERIRSALMRHRVPTINISIMPRVDLSSYSDEEIALLNVVDPYDDTQPEHDFDPTFEE